MTWDKNNIQFASHPTDTRFIDLTGAIFSRLTILGYAGVRGRRRHYWFARCVCGTLTCVSRDALRGAKSQSCGCLKKEMMPTLHITHGEKRGGKISVEYTTYCGAKQRCHDTNGRAYKDYGGRGIEFRFESFDQFLVAVGRRPSPKHSIERKDVNGHYEPGNVVWATAVEQGRNKRNTRQLTLNGRTQPLTAWCEELGVNYSMVKARIHRGWSPEKALSTPSLR